jgi:ribosomal protein L40E
MPEDKEQKEWFNVVACKQCGALIPPKTIRCGGCGADRFTKVSIPNNFSIEKQNWPKER